MCNSYEISALPLSLRSNREKVERFLALSGLRLEAVDYYAVACDDQDRIVAGGGLKDDVIKCIAVSDDARNTGLSNKLISHLIRMAAQSGTDSVKVFTKPGNRKIFESMGFVVIAQSPQAVLMENGVGGVKAYAQYLKQQALAVPQGRRGAIVMNANPFTRGHRYLVEQAAARVDHLFVIVVREDCEMFSYAERLDMVRQGCADVPHVTVLEGSDYAVSQFTFPTYFLKDLNEATPTHITLDIDLFATHIAPALGVSMRLVGSEPEDELTACYNAMMHDLLPARGVEMTEIPRLADAQGAPVSASRVRKALQDGLLPQALALTPAVTWPFLLTHLACQAMERELDLTPKPGLVDRHDNGAHRDMDYALMRRSIATLRPYFTQMVHSDDVDRLRALGQEAEHAMLAATGGVNTHRGALFCMGLALAAWHPGATAGELQAGIMRLAAQFPATQGTHGSQAGAAHHVRGALQMAREGYPQLFSEWLPALNRHHDPMRVLLLIMSQLDDTNVIYRVGYEQAQRVKLLSRQLLEHYSLQGVEQLNAQFVASNISPGGAADMLALCLLIQSMGLAQPGDLK